MKKIYTTLVLCITVIVMQAQTFDFSVSFIGINGGTNNYQMALVATPSTSVANGVTADMGAGFYLPSGLTIGNFVTGDSNIPGTEWSTQALGSNASGDAYFLSRVEAGSMSTILTGSGPFQLVLFDVIADPNPSSGAITFVENGDPIFDTLFVENYIEINLGGGTSNAYSQNDPAANSLDFATLGRDDSLLVSNAISVYPNPASDVINIESSYKIDSVELFDLLGKQVLRSSQTEQIRISHLPAGVYLLRVNSENGKLTKKVIIE